MTASVLAYGDSLTWGAVPAGQGRHPFADRWPNVVAKALPEVEVIAEGLRGRTTAFDVTVSPADMNGAAMLPSVLHTHAPLDLVVLLLGTNDAYCGIAPDMAARGLARLIEIVRHHPCRVEGAVPDILLVAPPVIVPSAGITERMIETSAAIRSHASRIASEQGVAFFDSNTAVVCAPEDGFHLDAANTRALGEALVPPISQELEARGRGRGWRLLR